MRRVHPSLTTGLAAALALSLTLTACGGDDKDDKDAKDPKGTANAEVLESTWPLTGEKVSGDASSSKKHPVYVVKIDNTGSSAPQIGLGSADMVVEELVEGGSTRLASFFYSKVPDNVGPVRSMRASDIGIVSPVDGEMVTSGAAGVTISRITQAGIKFHQEGATGFYRDSGRSAPYNLFVDLAKLAKEGSKGEEKRPDDYLPWGEEKDLPKGQPATSVAASFSAGHTTNWAFEGGKYHNQNTNAADGDEFLADTVLVLKVQVGDAGYTDPAGNFVPETKFHGKGEAVVFHKGKAVRGTWSKNKAESALTLKTKAGDLKIPAGHVWIELVPTDGGNVTFK
ncbi:MULTISPECIES: DUF3048 domain-containing protein [unclassified Nocardioides]|uniref:DUF3048 domain-containing protein n=1 Tax=unclassified Nocardioides TaxID=2615069 RepID=UPI000702033B|nr:MULTISPECIES: DUF3048 domain-containing protein [unclassified Nocardioides]KQY63530.1 hypothetical protein ASD30_00470 [Nocardioides sp. Root140]KQZ67430.1 hypothetical protein ASD66_21030 [Nocardioides sp. Root151]KRF17519.1 hypothetical protein ASH02_24970 [Nocardioides sp. Soil796]